MNVADTASAVADRLDEQDPDELPDPAGSALKRLQPYLSDDGRSATLAVVTGVISLLRAARTLRRGERKRGLVQALGGLFWIGLALVQRRRGRSEVEQTDVADTSPDIESVETDDPDREPATGADVVDTTDADIEESDTAPEVDSDVDSGDVDERDVVGTDDVESAAEGEAESSGDETESEAEMASDEEDGAESAG